MHRKSHRGSLKFWLATAAIAVMLAGLVGLLASRDHSSAHDDFAPSPTAEVTPPRSPSASPSTSTAKATSASPSATVATATPVAIAQSMPVELFIPSIGIHRTIHSNVCPIVDEAIDPDRSDYMVACVVTGEHLAAQLPGTSTTNATMIVGHTWRAKPTWQDSVGSAAFNALYNWESNQYTMKVGAEVWVRTQASGKRWLVYKITSFSQPAKTANNDDIWDFADKPAPGTLKLIGCLQPTDYNVLNSTHNIVVKAVFLRVQG